MQELIVHELVSQANALRICADTEMATRADADAASALLASLKEIDKARQARHTEVKRKIDAAKQQALDDERADREPVLRAIAMVTASILAWQRYQNLAAAAAAQAERDRKIAEAELARERMIEEAEAEGETELALELCALPVVVPDLDAAQVKRVGGHSVATTYVAVVEDLRALCGAVYRREIAPDVVQACLPALNAYGRASKGKMHVPGVRWQAKESLRQQPAAVK